MDFKLNENFFKEHFSSINLGLKPEDQCTDEEILAGAIPKLWIRELEREFLAKLYWAKFTGTTGLVGVVRKNELIRQPGDTIYINKISQLTADGDLGTTHTLEGNEEQLALGRIGLVPERKGNAVCWPQIAGKKVVFNMRVEVRDLLADWAARKVDSMIMQAAILTVNRLYGGAAQSKNALSATDTLTAHDLKRAMAWLGHNKAKKVVGATGLYVALVSWFQYFDLLNDPDWVAAARYDQSKRIWEGYVGTYMGVDVLATGQIINQQNEASPSVTVYSAIVFGARALALAWGQPWTWLEKVSSYGEQPGIGTDAWIKATILNPEYIYRIDTAATQP